MSTGAAHREPGGRSAPAQFIDPAVLARLGNLEMVARMVVSGFVSGLHQAVNLGVSPDFAEHRPYVPGDDVRRIDWRVFARTDRLYVKTFEAETTADVVLVLDVSASMGYASAGLTKLDYARYIVASIAHLAARQRDRIGFVAFDSDLIDHIPPSARHRDLVLRTLDRLEAAGRGDLPDALSSLAHRLRRRGIVVVVSDFYADPRDTVAALDELRLRGQDVIAFHVLDPSERDLDIPGPAVLEDAETGERLPVDPDTLREEYRALIDAHVAALADRAGERRIDYTCVTSDEPLDHVLFRYLSDRVRLARVR